MRRGRGFPGGGRDRGREAGLVSRGFVRVDDARLPRLVQELRDDAQLGVGLGCIAGLDEGFELLQLGAEAGSIDAIVRAPLGVLANAFAGRT